MIAIPPTSHQSKVLRTYVNSDSAAEVGRKLGNVKDVENTFNTITTTIRRPNVIAHLHNTCDLIGATEVAIISKMNDCMSMKKVTHFSKDGIVTDTKEDEDGHLQLKAANDLAELRGMKINRSESLNLNINVDNPETIPIEDLNAMISKLTDEVTNVEYEIIED